MQTRLEGFMFRVLRQKVVPEGRPDYRAAAAVTLSKLGSRAQEAIPALRVNASVPGGDREPQSMAIAALILLGADSLDAWADNLLSPTNSNWMSSVFAAGVLQTNAAPVVGRLAYAYETTTDDAIKWRITMALRLIGSNLAICVPVLRASLTNDNSQMKSTAMFGLMRFGAESKPAWDDLVPLLSDSNRTIRSIATNTLRRIDREAAQQLGIE